MMAFCAGRDSDVGVVVGRDSGVVPMGGGSKLAEGRGAAIAGRLRTWPWYACCTIAPA